MAPGGHLEKLKTSNDQISVHCTECPAGFTYISSVNGCYKVVTRGLTWTAAGLECRSLHKDAHLLVINDAAEQLVVAGMLESISGQCLLHVLVYCFVLLQ